MSIERTEPGIATSMLTYERPFDFGQLLSFLRPRAIAGVEIVSETSYSRSFRLDNTRGYFSLTDNPRRSMLELTTNCEDIKCHGQINNKVRRMFDLDTDFSPINTQFQKDRYLSGGLLNGQAPRLPVTFSPFEAAVRAVLGQQISVKAATTLASRVAERAGQKTDDHFPAGLNYFFPSASDLANQDLEGTGITQTRQETVKTVARAVDNHEVKLTANQPFDIFFKEFSALKGIGEWTVNYVAMRGLGMADSFPAGDLGIIKALSSKGRKRSKREILKLAEKWRPYRAYAALCLWNTK